LPIDFLKPACKVGTKTVPVCTWGHMKVFQCVKPILGFHVISNKLQPKSRRRHGNYRSIFIYTCTQKVFFYLFLFYCKCN